MAYIDVLSTVPFDILARAGGGGSSSGGGSGGAIIALIGYVPMHFMGAKLRKHSFGTDLWILVQVIGWIICAVYCYFLLYLGSLGVVITSCAVLGTGAGLYNWLSRLKRNKGVKIGLQSAAQADPTWNEAAILERATSIFYAYQSDWSARNWQAMAQYMTPRYARHASLMVAALLQAHRIDEVKDPSISQIMIVDMRDASDNAEDMVVVGITAKADDRLMDDRDGRELFKDTAPFTEYWQFRRHENEWLLNGIQQATESGWQQDIALQRFAEQQGYFYSLDWGWLLLPRQGRLFGASKFGTADINNHIIGVYNQSYLLQLYTYIPNPQYSRSYLIAQTNVPKAYGDIVVRRKKAFRYFAPAGLRRISMEWGDFNKKYDVFASSSEGATSFELLHPAFMEKLEALPFEVNLEVVDNVVYLYAPQQDKNAALDRYALMLAILREAYKQMKI